MYPPKSSAAVGPNGRRDSANPRTIGLERLAGSPKCSKSDMDESNMPGRRRDGRTTTVGDKENLRPLGIGCPSQD